MRRFFLAQPRGWLLSSMWSYPSSSRPRSPDPVTQAQQQLQLSVVPSSMHRSTPVVAHERPRQVALLGEQLGQQVAGARRHRVTVGGERREQVLGLLVAAEVEQRAGQVNPGSAKVTPPSSIAAENSSAAAAVRRHSSTARPPAGGTRPAGRLGLLCQFAHANSGPHMIASTCRLELDLVEVFDVRHSSHGTPAALLNSHGFSVAPSAARACEALGSDRSDHANVAG